MKLPRTLQTKRLSLRPWTFTDIEDILAYATSEEWSQFLPVPQPYKRKDAEYFIAKQLLWDPSEHVSYSVSYEGKIIGGANVRTQELPQGITLGYSLSPAYWGQGMITEVVKQLIDVIFKENPEVQRVQSYADERNKGSWRVMEKSGMTREGKFRKNRLHRGEWVDDVWYAILREEWESQGLKRLG